MAGKAGMIRDPKSAAMTRVAQFLDAQEKGIDSITEDTMTLLAVALNTKKRHIREMLTSLLQQEEDIEDEEIETSTQAEQAAETE